MGEATREILRGYYRKYLRKLIENDPEALVQLFVGTAIHDHWESYYI